MKKIVHAYSVLIVDDSHNDLRLLVAILESEGYKTRTLTTGSMVLESVKMSQPDVILLDVMMTDMSGYTVCETLKAHEFAKDIPIIFISALDDVENKIQGFALGGVDYISKPFQVDEVLARVQTHLTMRRMQQQLQAQNEQLQREVAERRLIEQALQRANTDLQQRVDELSTLNRIAQTVATVNELPSALEIVGETIAQVFQAQSTVLSLLNENHTSLTILAHYHSDTRVVDVHHHNIVVTTNTYITHVIEDGCSLLIAHPHIIPELETGSGVLWDYDTQCLLLIPLKTRGTCVGMLSIASNRDGVLFSRSQVALAETVASYIAGAIENTRLYEQAQAVAVDEERQRLARELHDSVTQALFSASLVAEVLLQMWQNNPDDVVQGLDALRRLTRGALAEMRTLLVELRPSALTEAPLGELIQQLTEAVTSQIQVQVTQSIDSTPLFPPDVQVALYRIVQEAFNNIVRHAQANTVTVELHYCSPEDDDPLPSCTPQLELIIRDDGRGCDLHARPPDRLGLSIMRERADQIGATFMINSQPGYGTEVIVQWYGTE